jgi:propanol-preferring alcohol dehydrogenase
MGLQVIAVDIDDEKLALAQQAGASLTINSAKDDPERKVLREIGGAHGVLVATSSLSACRQGILMTRRRGTCVLVGLPPGEFAIPVFDLVSKRITIRGSLLGTRADMQQALSLAAIHGMAARITTEPLGEINKVFDRLRQGKVQGRVVIDFSLKSPELAPIEPHAWMANLR